MPNNNVTKRPLVDKQGNIIVPITHIEAVYDSEGNTLPEYLNSIYVSDSKPAAENGTDLSLVTTGEKYIWNSKYAKPSTGIPSTDLASGVLTSLDKANTAIPNTEKGQALGVATLDSTGKVPSSLLPSMNYIPNSEKGANGGVATLDNTGKIPSSQLPSYVDDVIEGYYYGIEDPDTHETVYNFYSDVNHTEFITPESGKIYIDLPSGKTYRWSGSIYAEISSSDIIGIKVGQSGNVINPSQGVVTIPSYEEGAQVHIAPTSAEVKLALGTGSGTTKFLREDGTWLEVSAAPEVEIGETAPTGDVKLFVDEDADPAVTLDVYTRAQVDAKVDDTVHLSAQTLTEAQKAQARTNIGVVGNGFSLTSNETTGTDTLVALGTSTITVDDTTGTDSFTF